MNKEVQDKENTSFYDLGYQHGIDGKPKMFLGGSYADGYYAGVRFRKRWFLPDHCCNRCRMG